MCLTITSKDGLNHPKSGVTTLKTYHKIETLKCISVIGMQTIRMISFLTNGFHPNFGPTTLKYMEIFNVIATEKCSSKMAETLSRLSRLETIKLKVNNNLIANQIEAKVIEKCRKIRSIYIKAFK